MSVVCNVTRGDAIVACRQTTSKPQRYQTRVVITTMGRPPPFLFGYCYPCSDYHSSTSTDENMSDYYSSDSDYSDEETDATGGFRHRAYPKHLLLSSPATAEHHKTFKTPPLECNTQSGVLMMELQCTRFLLNEVSHRPHLWNANEVIYV